jgi:quercetin dioxygenase-like cupin family protein
MPNLIEIKGKKLTEGIIGKYVHGMSSTLGWVNIKEGSILPAHHHPHEQITLMIEGTMEMKIGEETFLLEPGDIHVIPSNVVHSAFAKTECTLIDVFAPVREEYKK